MPADAPTIHFVVPYVGDEGYLRTAVESVLAQSDARWLLTVVEDGPQGWATGSWLASLGDPRISYVLNPRRTGISANFQRCLDLARSEYVVFLGCDDELRPGYVSLVRALIREHPEASVIQPGVVVMDELGRRIRPLGDRVKARLTPAGNARGGERGGERLVTSLMHGNWTYFPSLAWRRETIAAIGFRGDLPITLDLALLMEVLMNGGRMVTTSEVAFCYRRHAASASTRSARSSERFAEEARLFGELEQRFSERGWPRAARAASLHLTSRLHAAALVPTSLTGDRRAALVQLVEHVARRPRRSQAAALAGTE